MPGVASILLVTVPVLVFCGSWPSSETDRQSLFAWLFSQYGEDFLPALFAIRGAWLLLSQRKARAKLPSTPDLRGFGGFLAMLALYAVARWLKLPGLGYVSVVGMGWFLMLASKGAAVWRSLAAPGIWFVLATPGLFKPLTLPLRIATAGSVAGMLNLLGVPVAEHGTVIVSLSQAGWNFTVADECSGTRTITTLLFVALLVEGGAFRGAAKAIILLSAFPVGLAMNILRTLTIGVICDWRGEGVGLAFHDSLLAGAGPLIVGTGFILLLAHYFKQRVAPR